ncbi:MAG: ABC transporter permease, partial [Calditrichia bacterium]
MKQSLYLAYRYLIYHKVRSLVLIFAIGVIVFLPNGLQRLIEESEIQMMARARSTPLIIGTKGSSTDLVINTMYFQQEKIEMLTQETVEQLSATKMGNAIPILSGFHSRGFPIVGTTLDYFDFRQLRISQGRNLGFVGECVIGSQVAEKLELDVGDSLISSPEIFFDLAGVYPLKMQIVGVLAPSNTPDDQAIFTDLKSNWVIMGLGHGHQDLAKVYDPTLIMDRSQDSVTATAKLYIYNEINGNNLDSFHFHGDINDYPVSAVIFVPNDQKSSTILRGRFEGGELPNQIVVPTKVVENLLQSIFRIKQIFNSVFLLVGFATLLILGLIVALSLRLRRDEIYTMFTIGSSRAKVFEILSFEMIIMIALSATLALIMYYFTGYFVDDFMRT